MSPNEIARLQAYLRRTFANEKITLVPPAKRGQPVEVTLGEEFIGTVYRDEDDGEVSFAFQMTILAEDLPPRRRGPGQGAVRSFTSERRPHRDRCRGQPIRFGRRT